MKKTLGYGYKLSNESIDYALSFYVKDLELLHTSKEKVEKVVREAKKIGMISKNSKPKIFKVVVEIA